MPIRPYLNNGHQVIRDGKRGWELDYYSWNGKRKRKVFYGTKKQANAILSQKINEQNEIRSGRRKPSDYQRKRLSDVAEEHAEDLIYNKDRSPNTVRRYKHSVLAFRDHIGDLPIHEITAEEINLFKKKRREIDELTASGINCDLRSLRAILNFAKRKEYIPSGSHIFQNVEMASDRQKYQKQEGVRYFFEDELQLLSDAIRNENDTQILETFKMYLYSGARAKEILPANEFRWENINFRDNVITFNQQKTNSVRTITLVPQVKEILEGRKKRNPESLYPFNYRYFHIYNMIKRKYIDRICNLPNASIQTLRATTGAILLKAGWNIYDVSKYLGHSTVRTTEKHYADLLKEREQNMARDLGKYIDSL